MQLLNAFPLYWHIRNSKMFVKIIVYVYNGPSDLFVCMC